MQERRMSISKGYLVVIFLHCFDSAESDDGGHIENIMNGSDTKFLAEDKSVISTNIIRKENIGSRSINPHFIYLKRGWNRYFRSEWTNFCSFHSTYFQSVTFSCQSTY